MTTIAFDGQSLAADAGEWNGGTRNRCRKVFAVRRDGRRFLVAFTGTSAYCIAIHEWMRGLRERPRPLDFMPVENVNARMAVVVNERGQVFALSASLIYMPVHERLYAAGAGSDIAYGALEAGASAERAVRIAMKRTDYAAMGVDVVRL